MTAGFRQRVDSVRNWFFSPPGLICAGILLAGLLVPIAILSIFSLREDRAAFAISAGVWWMFGIILIHQVVPPAIRGRQMRESLGAAAWHAGLTLLVTAPVAWMLIFRSGLPAAYTLIDVLTLAAYGGIFTAVFGVAMIWVRGHAVQRTIQYSLLALVAGVVWAILWLILNATIF